MVNNELRIQKIKEKADQKQQLILKKEEARERMFEAQREDVIHTSVKRVEQHHLFV